MEEKEIHRNLRKYNNLSREHNELYRGFGREYGLADCAVWILYILRESDETYTQRDICERLHQSKQTINTSLKKLEEAGLLGLRYVENNKKSKEIFLTPEGILLAEKTADKIMEAERRALAGLSEEEQNTFFGLYDKFIKSLRTELEEVREPGIPVGHDE